MHDSQKNTSDNTNSKLIIAGKSYNSRLLVGSGKYKDYQETLDATLKAGAEIITVAIRRTNIGQDAKEENLLDIISPDKFTILPNTAGCYTAIDAIRTCKLARELLGGNHNLVKLEVLGDEKTLYPNITETIEAAKFLVEDGFEVMVYTNDDPIVAKTLEDIGCVAIMPLGSLIGSGRGITNPAGIQMIKENASVPVLVDAGIGCVSDATLAMELGVDAVLVNSAIAMANNPVLMAGAMKNAVIAGRDGFLAKRMDKKLYASASSPMSNLI
jgi:thiazole synthase